jgi:hypothetical protein
MPKNTGLTLPVESRILHLRNHKVILDTDLAEPLWRIGQTSERAGEEKPGAFFGRLPIPAHCQGA